MTAEISICILCTAFALFCLFLVYDQLDTNMINQVNLAKFEILNAIEKLQTKNQNERE